MKKFETTGSKLNKNQSRNRTFLTEAKLNYIGAILECLPQKLVRKLVHLLHLKPYHYILYMSELLQLVFRMYGSGFF